MRPDRAESDCQRPPDSGPLRLLVALLAGLTAFKCALVGRFTPLFFYPFTLPDSHDWIANGLAHAGYPVASSGRPPALPLLIAALEQTGTLHLLPVFNQVALALLVLTCFSFLKRHFDPWAALIAGLILYLSYFLQSFSFYIMADIYAVTFMVLSIVYFVDAADSPRRYIASSVCFGISALFQYAALVVLIPAYLVIALSYRRGDLTRRPALLALGIGIVIPSAWFLSRWVHDGELLQSGVLHLALVKPHMDGIPHYLLGLVSLLGVPFFALFVVGLVLSLARVAPSGRRDTKPLLLAVLAANVVFWVLLYNWNDRRFLIYWILPLSWFATAAIDHGVRWYRLARVRRKAALVSALLVTLVYAQIGYPGPLVGDRLALSPHHFLVFGSRVDARGRLTVDLSRCQLLPTDRSTASISLFGLVGRLRAPAHRSIRESYRDLLSFRRHLDRPGRAAAQVAVLARQAQDRSAITRASYSNVLRRTVGVSRRLVDLSPGSYVILGVGPSDTAAHHCQVEVRGERLVLCHHLR